MRRNWFDVAVHRKAIWYSRAIYAASVCIENKFIKHKEIEDLGLIKVPYLYIPENQFIDSPLEYNIQKIFQDLLGCIGSCLGLDRVQILPDTYALPKSTFVYKWRNKHDFVFNDHIFFPYLKYCNQSNSLVNIQVVLQIPLTNMTIEHPGLFEEKINEGDILISGHGKDLTFVSQAHGISELIIIHFLGNIDVAQKCLRWI